MGGVNPREGAVISRNRLDSADVWRLDPPERYFLVETNYDHWEPVPRDDPRRTVANALMNASTPATVGLPYINSVLTTIPVFNPETTYTALMCAGNGTLDAVTRNEHD
jgi:N-acylethanolamine-hydrolysing acid amidase